MDSVSVFRLSMELVAADIISEYIPLKPVLDNRSELIEERILAYKTLIAHNLNTWEQLGSARDYSPHQVDKLIEYAVMLVRADIACNFIGHSPVLCDRDTMITQSISKYMEFIEVPALTQQSELSDGAVSCCAEKPRVNGKKKNKRFPRKGRK